MKKILPFILALAILSGCAAGKEVTETSGTSGTVTTSEKSETTVTETTTVTTETTEVSAEAEDASIIDSIKETLKAKWSNNVFYVQMYAEDLNGDGIKELFVNYSPKLSNKCGVTYVFDVSDGVKKLYEISLMTAKGYLYTDESGGVHYIIRTGYSDGMDRYAYYDVAYDSIEIPFYADTKSYDNSKVYKNCKVMPNSSRTGFNSLNAEFVGNFNRNDIYMAWFKEESNEISELVSEVFDGLTYASEAASIYLGRNFENFEDFIKEAEPKLELVYGDAEAADTSNVDYIKEALKAEWNNDVRVADLYTVDLNGDGVKELLVNYSFGVAANGFVYVYDVSDGVKKLYEIAARIWAGSAELYSDADGKTHVILEHGYASSASSLDHAFYDITYDNIQMPFYADVYDWYDGGAHIFEYDIYKNCEVVPNVEVFEGWRNFDKEKAEYVGRFSWNDFCDAVDKGESNEVSDIIQKEVFEGLTCVSDIEELYRDSGYTADYDTAWDFEYFWQGAAPILSEVYGDTASEN